MTTTKFDIYEAVTERIITQLEKGVIPWRMPWKTGEKVGRLTAKTVAFNRVTKTAYSALNQFLLAKPGEYATFNQWKDAGGSVKKGAKSHMVVFWKVYQKTETDTTEDGEEETKIKGIPVLRYYHVFHIDDVDGVKPLTFSEDEPVKFNAEEEAENVISAYLDREGIALEYGGARAYYSPSRDYIRLPQRSQFGKNGAEFYSTAFHEITHSTGHATRLNRGLNGCAAFGSEDYSKEDLIAEIGAAGALSLLGIETPDSFTNSVAYVQSWIQALRNDPRMIVSASSKLYLCNGDSGGLTKQCSKKATERSKRTIR